MDSLPLKRQNAEEIYDELAERLDPLAFWNDDPRDRHKRRRQVYAKVRPAMREYERALRQDCKPEEDDWMKGAVMTNEVLARRDPGEPMMALAVELAGMIDPAGCGRLQADGLNPILLTDDQHYTLNRATEFIRKVCVVTEQEYATYLFRKKAVVA